MQIEFNGKIYEITSRSTEININALKTLVDHNVRLEDIKSSDKASDFLPEIFNSSNDVAAGEVLRNLRYSAKKRTLPQIWKDFLSDNGYDFNISKFRGEQSSKQHTNHIIKILQLFVDHGIDLNNIPQRASAKDILPSVFNDDNDLNIGTVLQYIRTKYKNNALDSDIQQFLIDNNFIFAKQSKIKEASIIKKQIKLKIKQDKQLAKQNKLREKFDKKLRSKRDKEAKANKTTNQQLKNLANKQNETNGIYKKSKNNPRKKAHILKLIVSNGIDLNNVEKSALASQLLPAKSISADEDFDVGKLIYVAKKKFAKNTLKPAAINALKKLGVDFDMQQKSLVSKCIEHTKSAEINLEISEELSQTNTNQAPTSDQPSAEINSNNDLNL